MARTKTSTKTPRARTARAEAPAPSTSTSTPRAVDRDRLVIRGLSADDLARLGRATATAQRQVDRTAPGARVSRNAVVLGLLRAALATAEASGSVQLAPAGGSDDGGDE